MPQLSPNLLLGPDVLLGDGADRGWLATQVALVERIAVLPLLESALVREGFATDLPKQPNRVYVMDGVPDIRRTPTGHQGVFTETYTISLVIHARTYYPHDEHGRSAKREAKAIFDAIDTMLREDHEIGGAVRDAYISTSSTQTGVPDGSNDGWLSEITAGITCEDFI